jgi:hypothetical protein
MVLDATGQLGIGGNLIPSYKLDVAGVIRSSTGGFRFPDNTVQTTAATGNTSLVRTVIVSPAANAVSSGTALKNALAGITTASPTNPWLLKIEPGIYDLNGSALTMKQYVDIEGSGELATIITTTGFFSVLVGANNAEVRSLTVRNTGSTGQGAGISNNSASPRIRQVTVAVSGSTTEGFGISNSSSSPAISNVTVTCSGGTGCTGIANTSGSAPVIQNSSIVASGSPSAVGIGSSTSMVTITNSKISGVTFSVSTQTSGTTLVAVSQLVGSADANGTGTNTCVGAYNSNFAAIGTTCN